MEDVVLGGGGAIEQFLRQESKKIFEGRGGPSAKPPLDERD